MAAGRGAIPREFWTQIIMLSVSAAAGLWLASRPIKSLFSWSKTLWIVTLVVLLLVKLFGTTLNGGQRWFSVGPFHVQPAEFAKVTVIIYLAAVLHHWKAWPKKTPTYKSFAQRFDNIYYRKILRLWPAALALLGIGLIVIEPDLGTGAILAAVAWLMFAVGGVTRKSIVWGSLACVILCGIAIKMEPYRVDRITNHLNRWDAEHVDDTGFQTVQSELAMSSGGWVGVGVGAGRAKHIMPAATTDFVTSTVAEEFGFLGWSILMAPLVALCIRLLQLAKQAPTKYGSLVLIGTGSWLAVQSMTNILMANGTLPAIGIPLPFYSSGGSSLIAIWIALGVSQTAMQPILVKTEATDEAHRDGWGHGRTRISSA
jgi:cell division protein FtsW